MIVITEHTQTFSGGEKKKMDINCVPNHNGKRSFISVANFTWHMHIFHVLWLMTTKLSTLSHDEVYWGWLLSQSSHKLYHVKKIIKWTQYIVFQTIPGNKKGISHGPCSFSFSLALLMHFLSLPLVISLALSLFLPLALSLTLAHAHARSRSLSHYSIFREPCIYKS